ncbi:MAG: hypothetical protein V9F01_17975 [Chitinophagaceae bacterium]
MKKIFVSFSLLLTAGLSAVFASTDPNPDQKVLDLFNKEFASAENVTWNKQDEYDKATFILAGRRTVAYFNPEGLLEGCARELSFDQLPLAVMTAIDRRFAEKAISSVLEISNSEGTNYKLTLKTKTRKYKVKVDSAGNITEVSKLPK